jgi:hypothetical protein
MNGRTQRSMLIQLTKNQYLPLTALERRGLSIQEFNAITQESIWSKTR